MGRKSKAKKLSKQQSEPKKVDKPGFFKRIFSRPKAIAEPKKSKPARKRYGAAKTGPGTSEASTASNKKPKIEKVKVKEAYIKGLLVFIIVIVFFTLGYFIFQKAFRAKSVAKFLPAQNTVALFEINTNFDHSQVIKTTNLLKGNAEYSREALISRLEKFLNVSYENDLKPWFGRSAGMVLVNSKNEEALDTLYFVENKNNDAFTAFLKRSKSKANTYGKTRTYLFGDKFYITEIDDYIFASLKEQTIYELIDAQDKGTSRLHNLASYRRVDNNLPLNKIAFFYVNFDEIKDGFFKSFSPLSQAGFSLQNLAPFLRLFDAEGMALIAMDNNFSVQSFLALDSTVTENISYDKLENKYSAGLADYVTKDVAIFWGSQNLEAEIAGMLEILATGDTSTIKVFENVLENYAKKYFGSAVSLKDDLFPLFENEFALSLAQNGEKNIYQLLLRLDSPQKDGLRIHEIANNFSTVGAIFEPKVVEHTLPDGTTSKEIIAVPEEIVKAQHPYEENIIYELRMSKQDLGIYYSIFDDVAVIANDIESVKTAIDLGENNSNSLRANDYFKQRMEPIIKTSDEIVFINLDKIISDSAKKSMPLLVDLIDSLSSGKNYFNDGIVTVSYIYLK